MEVHADKVISNSAAQTDDHLAVSRWIPCNAGPRLQVFPLALHSGFSVEARITGITEARRCARDDFALDALVEILQAERVNVAVCKLHRHEWSPAKSIVQRELACRLPCVLQIERKIVLRQVFRIRIGLVQLR